MKCVLKRHTKTFSIKYDKPIANLKGRSSRVKYLIFFRSLFPKKVYFQKKFFYSVLGQFPDGLFPNEQFPEDIFPMDSSPDGQFPGGQFLERTVPRLIFPRTDISPNGHFPESHFFIYLNLYLPLVHKSSRT